MAGEELCTPDRGTGGEAVLASGRKEGGGERRDDLKTGVESGRGREVCGAQRKGGGGGGGGGAARQTCRGGAVWPVGGRRVLGHRRRRLRSDLSCCCPIVPVTCACTASQCTTCSTGGTGQVSSCLPTTCAVCQTAGAAGGVRRAGAARARAVRAVRCGCVPLPDRRLLPRPAAVACAVWQLGHARKTLLSSSGTRPSAQTRTTSAAQQAASQWARR